MRSLGFLLCLFVPLTAVIACSSSDSGGSGQTAKPSTPFQPSPDAVPVGDTGIYLPPGSERVSGAPPASAPEIAPVIKSITPSKVDEHTIDVEFEVETVVEVDASGNAAAQDVFVYVDFGATIGIYKTKPTPASSANGGDAGAGSGEGHWPYEDIAGPCQGPLVEGDLSSPTITCTPECLAACDCVTCPDRLHEADSKGTCALACERADRSGVLANAPFNGSRDAFASFVFDTAYWTTPDYPTSDFEQENYGITRGAALSDPDTCKPTKCGPAPSTPGTASTPVPKPSKSERHPVPLNVRFQAPSFSTDVIFDSIAQTGATGSQPEATSQRAGQAKLGPTCAPSVVVRCR
jgi:hypothetical protein